MTATLVGTPDPEPRRNSASNAQPLIATTTSSTLGALVTIATVGGASTWHATWRNSTQGGTS